ncbi:MAG: tetratricopeptide repeat protein, partial [Pseudomonadota bacterium]
MSISGLVIAKACITSFVAVVKANEGDYEDAMNAGQLGGLPLIGALLQGRLKDRQSCLDHEVKQLGKHIEAYQASEGLADDGSVMADLNEFGPELLSVTRLTAFDIAQEAGGDHGAIMPVIRARIPADTKYAALADASSMQGRLFETITLNIYTRFFGPRDPSHELDRAIALDTNAVARSNADDLAEIKEMVAKLSGSTADESAQRELKAALIRVAELEAENNDLKGNTTEPEDALADILAGDPTRAERLLQDRIDAKEPDVIQLAADYRALGAIRFLHDTHGALQAYERSTQLDPNDMDGWNQLGHLQDRLGELDTASRSYNTVLVLADGRNDDEARAIAFGNLGIMLQMRGDLDGAEDMYRKSLSLDEALDRKEGMANQCGNLGNLLQMRGDLDGAEEMYRKSLALHEALGRKEGLASVYANLSLVAYQRGH